MSGADEKLPIRIEQYRDYLVFLARVQMDARLLAMSEPSDIVQQTLLKAHENLADFRGKTDGEIQAWLRAIMAREFVNLARKHSRPLSLHSLEAALEQSSALFGSLLAAEQSTPSQAEMRAEQLIKLTETMATLPKDQQTALTLRYLEGLSVAGVAERMNRTMESATGLIYRGTKALRERMREPT